MRRQIVRVFTGPMFSGKTSRLLKDIESIGPKYDVTQVVKWSQDTRSGSAQTIATHAGEKYLKAKALESLDEIRFDQVLGSHFIAVDEIHFFGADLLRLWERLQYADFNFSLSLSGLDLDFKKEKIGYMLELINTIQREQEKQPNCGIDLQLFS
mmetsp:Transcript_7713/g.10066  ORF Transcript_7713/g.10066 Transcript_7713/m.10066 type:complete len:154 (+) Transcript_7713:116-577(+)